MLGANRVGSRISPPRGVADILAKWRSVKNLGKGSLSNRRGQNIEERTSKDVAVLLTQIVDCLAGLGLSGLTVRWHSGFRWLWRHLGP